MSKIIRAVVLTNSSDDAYSRVKLTCEGIWNETPLVESVGAIPLKKDDVVFVDISDGFENPIILGRSQGDLNSFHKDLEGGSLLFESSNGNDWTIGFVKVNKLEIVNSSEVSIVIEGDTITINGGKLGGLINIEDLVSKLNSFVDDFNGHTHSNAVFSGSIGGAPASGSLMVPAPMSKTSDFNKNDFEDTKVIH